MVGGKSPQPVAHPPQPIPFVIGCTTVRIGGKQALRVNDQTAPCSPPGCVPGIPGKVAQGSVSVRIGGMPAARVTDIVSFPGCVTAIASPMGKVMGPGAPSVLIGG
jgi:uncharacterized Zn-binding protein involved in type VI secretion